MRSDHQIALPDRTAPREHDEIRVAAGLDGFRERVDRVPGRLVRLRHAAMRSDDGGEREAVDVVDVAGLERPSRLDNFVTGRENRDARLGVDGHVRAADGRQGADAARRQHVARADDKVAGHDVGTAAADVPAGCRRHPHLNVISSGSGFLDHHDGVGAGGHGRAGRDFGARTRFHGDRRYLSRVNAVDEPQPCGCGRCGGGRVDCDHGIAVHQSACERRYVDR